MHKLPEPTINSKQPSKLLAMLQYGCCYPRNSNQHQFDHHEHPAAWSKRPDHSNAVVPMWYCMKFHMIALPFKVRIFNRFWSQFWIRPYRTYNMVGFVLNHRMAKWPHVQYSQAPSPHRLNMITKASIERLSANGCHLLKVPNATSTAIPLWMKLLNESTKTSEMISYLQIIVSSIPQATLPTYHFNL